MQPGNRERAPYRVARRARNAAVAGGSGQARNALSVGHGLVQLLLELGLCLFRLLPQLQGTGAQPYQLLDNVTFLPNPCLGWASVQLSKDRRVL